MIAQRPLTMLTFAPMIDCENTRRVLDHYDLRYRERDRLFGWVTLLTFLHGGYGRIPLVYGLGMRCSGPMAIVRMHDLHHPHARLVPPEQPLRRQVEADFALYNDQLASAVAAVAYYHLLPARDAMIESFGGPITPLGRAMLPYVYPALRALFGLLLRFSPARIADATLRIEALLDRTDARVSDGRRYLAGDRLTLGDIGLATAMAPITLPPPYAPHVPPLEAMPPVFRHLIERTRARPSARFAARIYEELATRIPPRAD